MGEVSHGDKHILSVETSEYIGVLLKLGFPLRIEMPCGEAVEFERREDFPLHDVPCPCGRDNHWAVKWGRR